MLQPMEYREATFNKVSPMKFKVLASARVHELEAGRCPPVQMVQRVRQTETKWLFKIIIAMMAIGLIATIPFWRSEKPSSTDTSISKVVAAKNDTNITKAIPRKRDLSAKINVADVAAPKAKPQTTFIGVVPEEEPDLKIIIQRTDGKDIHEDVEILEMAIANDEVATMTVKIEDDNSYNDKYGDAVIDDGLGEMDYEDERDTEELPKQALLQVPTQPLPPPSDVSQIHSWYITEMVIAFGILFIVLLIAICVLLFWNSRQEIFFAPNDSSLQSEERKAAV